MRRGLVIAAAFGALVAAAPAHAARTEVVAELQAPPLARAVARSRALSLRVRHARLNLSAPTSTAYLDDLATAQDVVAARIRRAIPGAVVRWRYRIVLNGLAVDLPGSAVGRLARVPGVAHVTRGVGYAARLDHSTDAIDAPFLWGPTFSTAGQGLKIGIVDDGVEASHPFFDPRTFAPPSGFPKGNTQYTTAKVIVARAFAPRRPAYADANKPFDPKNSFHGTHVAGIAAGDRGTNADGEVISGVAPAAYIGNYKVLTIPSDAFEGVNGNSPEITAGIEAAVRDGMDVINLSLGQPEVEPSRDIVARAIDAAVDAGVVATLAAGNDYDAFGDGSVISPATAAKGITAAAVLVDRQIARFSAAGPTPLSLRLKPDVAAPGVNVLSSVPARDGTWASFDGTSMAAPHVAGGAALLRQRHPGWTPAQIKSALVLTGRPVLRGTAEVPTTRQGGGMIDLQAADDPRVFADPAALSFGLLRPGRSAGVAIALTDAGGGSGAWDVAVERQPGQGGATVSAAASVGVPGTLTVVARAPAGAAEGDVTGFVVLTRGTIRRHVPFWLRVSDPALARERHSILPHAGVYVGDTRGLPALVDSYRYPADPSGVRVPAVLAGPEQVFRLALKRPVANFGVRIVGRAAGVGVQPRIVRAGNEDRLATQTALPIVVNPYLRAYLSPVSAAGVIRPGTGSWDVVFDSATRAGAGRFRFRLWIDDRTPPSVRLLARSVRRGSPLRVRLRDAGSGVWPPSVRATVDGTAVAVRYSSASGVAKISTSRLARGRHRLVFTASDYQETRNHENAGPILPNTRTLTVQVRVR